MTSRSRVLSWSQIGLEVADRRGNRFVYQLSRTAQRVLGADDRRFLERVQRATQQGIADEGFNVLRLASALAMDRTQLFRRLKKVSGWTPSQLLLDERLGRAADLLSRRECGVTEVTLAVGFKSVSHFGERFRRRFHVCPSDWKGRRAGDAAPRRGEQLP